MNRVTSDNTIWKRLERKADETDVWADVEQDWAVDKIFYVHKSYVYVALEGLWRMDEQKLGHTEFRT